MPTCSKYVHDFNKFYYASFFNLKKYKNLELILLPQNFLLYAKHVSIPGQIALDNLLKTLKDIIAKL